MKVFLLEDNKSIQNSIKTILEQNCPEVELIGIEDTVEKAKEFLLKNNPDLLLLDVELPDGTSFELLKSIDINGVQAIFITAHEKYAIQAIKYSALDYILKPLDVDEFTDAIQKANNKLQQNDTDQKLQTLLKNLSQPEESKKIVLHDKYGIQIVPIEDIIHLEANGSYTSFFVKGMDPLMISKGLKEYETLLPNELFFRCHQSHLVNVKYLLRYDKKDGDKLILKNNDQVPLAHRKKDALLKLLKTI